MKIKLFSVLIFFLSITILLSNFCWADIKIEYSGCIMCHSAKGLNKKTDAGVQSLYIDENEFKISVHKNLECVRCHNDIKVIPHLKKLKKVFCSECHYKESPLPVPKFNPEELYKDSVHGIAAKKGVQDVPSCKDCHGVHNIKKPTDMQSPTYRGNVPKLCGKCHNNLKLVKKYHIKQKKAFMEYENSAHGKAIEKKGLSVAAVCTDCHGVHSVKIIRKPDIPKTCAKCHYGVYAVYIKSIHGQSLLKGIKEAPVCSDCHGEHTISSPAEKTSKVNPKNIPKTCAKCHENIFLQKKYGLAVKRMTTYMQSFHGVALKFGNVLVAECVSCHGYHNILPSSDPKSMVNKKNLPKTCGKCHPGAGKHFAEGTIHLIPSTKKDIGVYIVRLFYTIFIILLISSFVLYIILDLVSRIKRKH